MKSSVTRTVFNREFWAALYSPARYLSFTILFGFSAASLAASLQLAEGQFWTLQALWLLSVACPLPLFVTLITMPLIAGERASGTFEALELLPVPLRKIVIGKFMAAFLAMCLGLVGSIVPWLLLSHTLGPRAHVPVSVLRAPYCLLLLHAFSWTALGMLSSAVARRPWIAAAGTLLFGMAAMLLWGALSRFFLAGNLHVSTFPIWDELLAAASGHIALHSIVFHISFGLWALFMAIQVLEARR